MEILKKNLSVSSKLNEIYPDYRDSLYQIENSKTNNPTIKINEIYFHSKYDPLKEANRIVDVLLIDKEIIDVLIIFGCGLGYIGRLIYEKLIKDSKDIILPYIIYIEKDIKMFLTSLKYFDWSEILVNQNFKIFLDTEKELIGSFLQTIPTKRIRYYYHRPSYLSNQEYYKEVQNYISYVLDRKDMNTATFCNFQKLWTKNFIYNLPTCLYSKPIKLLSNIARDSTAIIIAAGPTLTACIPYLKSLKDKAIIIAVDTPYKFLKKNDISPDILVTIDPQYWNYKYLENEKINDTIIVSDLNVYHKVFKTAPKDNFFSSSTIFPIVKYFDQNNDKRGNLSAGGSVATSAFDVARIIGAKNIVLIGLDLSYPGRMTHFKGAFFETNFIKEGNYFQTAEYASYKLLSHVNMKVIESTNGKVFTDQKMFLFKKWFDREIPLTQAEVFLPDLGGAFLEGAKIIKIDELHDLKCSNKQIFLENKDKLLKIQNEIDIDEIKKKIDLILIESKEIKEICKKIIKLIPQDGLINLENANKVNNLETKLYNNQEKHEIINLISSSAQDILLSIMENVEFDKDQKSSAWIKTRHLYNSILELSDYYVNCLKKTLKNFLFISE